LIHQAAATETTEAAGDVVHLLRLSILQVGLERAHNVALLLHSFLTLVNQLLQFGCCRCCRHLDSTKSEPKV
jgi:hypothetical protein